MKRIASSVDWACAELRRREEAGFYGRVTVVFEAGRPTTIKVEETLKPPRDVDTVDNAA